MSLITSSNFYQKDRMSLIILKLLAFYFTYLKKKASFISKLQTWLLSSERDNGAAVYEFYFYIYVIDSQYNFLLFICVTYKLF